jgi:Rieske [2Fe-2S] domain
VIEQTRSQETYEVLREAKRALDEESKLLAKVYNEPGIFEMEAKKIFQKTWIFLAHESEIPWPGDYVLRRIIDDSFIVARDEDGQIHVLFNMCRHRGMQPCRRRQHQPLPLPLPWLHLQEYRQAQRRPFPEGGVRPRGARQRRVGHDPRA